MSHLAAEDKFPSVEGFVSKIVPSALLRGVAAPPRLHIPSVVVVALFERWLAGVRAYILLAHALLQVVADMFAEILPPGAMAPS